MWRKRLQGQLYAIVFGKLISGKKRKIVLHDISGTFNDISNFIPRWPNKSRDAGLVLSSLISFLIAKEEPRYPATILPKLTLVLHTKGIKVLELGTGCGIVSIALAHSHDSADITMTDLKDAQNIAQLNINTNEPPKTSTSFLSYRNLDWSEALPYSVFQTKFNIILVADCTYNPNSVPFLVDTLSSCADKDPEVLICVAMKIRHDSEIIFFQLMQRRQLGVVETLKLDLPVLGLPDNGEQIEIWVFRRGRTSRNLRNNATLVERLSPMPVDEQNWGN
jgi:predicted nicotinamide N-methyase